MILKSNLQVGQILWLKVNGIEDVDKIEVGQQLFIPRYNG